MSNKARSLRKRLKQKEESEPSLTAPSEQKLKTVSTIQENKKRPIFQAPKRRRDSYIDPLEYFQKEHLIIKEDKMDDLLEDVIPEEDAKKEESKNDEKPKPKPKGGMMMMGMPMPGAGGMPGMGFRINFEEMMKVRAKVKKEQEPKVETKRERPGSLKPRAVTKKEMDEEPDNDEEPKMKEGSDEQSLYIKLVMARNKYSELSSAKTNVYDKIIKQISELRQIKDLPQKYLEKVDEFESKLKIPDRLIFDPDVQEIENENEYEKLVEKPVNLDDVINSLNLAGTN